MGKVGYKRPPAHAQFAKGKSGNPSGRPKGTKKRTRVADFINRPVTMTLDGVQRQLSLDEATLMALTRSAMKGNTAAARLVLQLIEKAEQKQVEEERNPLGSCPPIEKFVLCGPDFEDCSEALFKLGAIYAAGKDWVIATWVVEAGLARGIGDYRSLKEEDYQDIAKSMAKPEDLPGLREKFG